MIRSQSLSKAWVTLWESVTGFPTSILDSITRVQLNNGREKPKEKKKKEDGDVKYYHYKAYNVQRCHEDMYTLSSTRTLKRKPNQPYHNKNITEPDTPLMKTRHNGTTLFFFSWIWGLSNPPDEKLNTYYCLQKFIWDLN